MGQSCVIVYKRHIACNLSYTCCICGIFEGYCVSQVDGTLWPGSRPTSTDDSRNKVILEYYIVHSESDVLVVIAQQNSLKFNTLFIFKEK